MTEETPDPHEFEQFYNLSNEILVWIVPVMAVWIVAAVLLTVLATPWWTGPDSVSIGLGVGGATLFAVYYANHRLNKLADLEVQK